MILASECRLDSNNLSLVGVSGGPDSMCLLHVMYQLGFPLVAVHVNHQLRPESGQEALIVEDFARSLGVNFILCQVDVCAYSTVHSLSIEEAARNARYEQLFEQAEQTGARAVVVAHNAGDQVETLLMHLLRGTGLAGLRGMDFRSLPNPWSAQIPLLRPLLATPREEILAYLAERKLHFASDQSNFDPAYTRNRLRHELLPILESYDPHLRQNLLRMSRINKEDYALIQQWVDRAWQAHLVKKGPGYVAFDLPAYQELSPSIRRYLLRRAIAHHRPSLRDVDFDSIERGDGFLCNRASHGQTDLIAGLRLLKEGRLFWLAAWQADLPGSDFPCVPSGQTLALAIPATLALGGEWCMQAAMERDPEQALRQCLTNRDPFQAWLDLSALELPLVLRRRKPGERFQPLGMQGHSMKLSDLMVNLKLPRRARPGWPVVCSGDQAVWVPGFRQGQLGQLQPTSRQVLHLILSRVNGA